MFSTAARTLDPIDIVRGAWKGYLTNMCAPWGMMSGPQGLQPMLRFYFEDQALPWPQLEHSPVDGLDTNTRNIGAHALLHDMLGAEKDNDPAEAGQIAYLLSLTPQGPESFIAVGELAKNALLLYEHTGQEWARDWAQKIVGKLDPPLSNESSLGGHVWMHFGWNIEGLSRWYELTGDEDALALAVACADRFCNSRDKVGDDGAIRPDGSFGGQSQDTTASWHMHGHTHCLLGLLYLGEQLLKAGQKDRGLRALSQAQRVFDWLYDPTRNPDAGSLTGWLGEWLMVATGWKNRKADCEGCTMGDMVQTACDLAAASRLDSSLVPWVSYYDRAEQIFRGQVVESIFRLTPEYKAVLKDGLRKRVGGNAIGAVTWHDQSKNKNHATLVTGDARLRTGAFPGGERAVIRFGGHEYFKLSRSDHLRTPRFSVSAVIRVTSGKNQRYYSNYDNPTKWGTGFELGVHPGRHIYFFTTDGDEKNYDRMFSSSAVSEGYHIITTTYDSRTKNIYADGVNLASSPSKGLDYSERTVACVGAVREFGFWFNGDIAEILIHDTVDESRQARVENYLSERYGIPVSSPSDSSGDLGAPLLWLKADAGYVREHPEPTLRGRNDEVERLYQEALVTAKRMEGRLLGLCGFPDWVNDWRWPHALDHLSVNMMGCCADAVIRAAHAVWSETVTGDREETRVNLAFNRASPLVDVVSCLPHRGEVNVLVKDTRKVLVRVPEWAPKERVRAYIDKKVSRPRWQGPYVLFDSVESGQQLTVTYPLRIAEIKETVGSLDGTEYTQKWRGNTIVDIEPPGKWIPMFNRPELDTERLP